MENLLSSLTPSKPVYIVLPPKIIAFAGQRGLMPNVLLPKAMVNDMKALEERRIANAMQLLSNLQESRPKMNSSADFAAAKVNKQNANQVVDFLTDPMKQFLFRKFVKENRASTARNDMKNYQKIKKQASDSIQDSGPGSQPVSNVDQRKNMLTVDEKIEALLLSRRGCSEEFSRLIHSHNDEDLPRKKVKGLPTLEVSEEDVYGVNALREIMLREKKRQLEQEALEQFEYEQKFSRTSSKTDDEEDHQPSETESERHQSIESHSKTAQDLHESLKNVIKREEGGIDARIGVKIEE